MSVTDRADDSPQPPVPQAESGREAAERHHPNRGDMERAILGDRPHLTAADIFDGDTESLELARQLWRALGFPNVNGAAAFTDADREAMRVTSGVVTAETLDRETTIKLTRAIGHTMARLADWQVATLSGYVEDLELEGRGTGSRLRTGYELLQKTQEPFEQLMLYAWRRHLAAAIGRVEALGATDSDLHNSQVTVGFADLVSFTRLSNGIDEDRLAELVEQFESLCADLVTAGGGRVIKTLGDSVLFITPGPHAGVKVASDIVELIGGDPKLPDVHVGLATGPVVMRLGDVFGPSVNLASRLTGIARRNRVICDATSAAALADVPEYKARPLTERAIRGFGTVLPYTIRRA